MLPFAPVDVFGRARAPVLVTVDDHEPFATTLMVYGGQPMIGLRLGQQREFGVGPGDRVHVRVAADDAPRTVDLPAELAAVLRDAPDAAQRFEQLSYTHRKEYARWVGDAKREETRERRAQRSVQLLRAGTKTPG